MITTIDELRAANFAQDEKLSLAYVLGRGDGVEEGRLTLLHEIADRVSVYRNDIMASKDDAMDLELGEICREDLLIIFNALEKLGVEWRKI